MYSKFPQSTETVLGYAFSGTITESEVKEVHKDIKRALRAHGRVRILMQLNDLSTPEPAAVWEDLKMTPEYVKDVDRFAIVGDATWHEWVSKATALVTRGEARYFKEGELAEAWEWIGA